MALKGSQGKATFLGLPGSSQTYSILRKHFVVKFQGSFQPIEERVQGKLILRMHFVGKFQGSFQLIEERAQAKLILRKHFFGKFQGSFQPIQRGAHVIPFSQLEGPQLLFSNFSRMLSRTERKNGLPALQLTAGDRMSLYSPTFEMTGKYLF